MQQKTKITFLSLLILSVVIWLLAGSSWLKVDPPKGTANLSWNLSSDGNTTGYKIYYGTNPRNGDCPSGGYAKNQTVGKVGQFKLSNLEPGKTYYFSVSARNSSGKESCFSEEMHKKISSAPVLYLQALWQKVQGK
ncbi:MAG: fibronectin type III domain-containing protein [Parcubacteria group bacterium]|jgi:hypothetical protein